MLYDVRMTWAFFHSGDTVLDRKKTLLPEDKALWVLCWTVSYGMKGLSDLRIWLLIFSVAQVVE